MLAHNVAVILTERVPQQDLLGPDLPWLAASVVAQLTHVIGCSPSAMAPELLGTRFDVILCISMRQQWFTHVRLLVAHLPGSCRDFPQRSPPRLLTGAARGGLGSPPARRTRRTYSITGTARIMVDIYFTITPLSGHTGPRTHEPPGTRWLLPLCGR